LSSVLTEPEMGFFRLGSLGSVLVSSRSLFTAVFVQFSFWHYEIGGYA
jgi:hypothetical protein